MLGNGVVDNYCGVFLSLSKGFRDVGVWYIIKDEMKNDCKLEKERDYLVFFVLV